MSCISSTVSLHTSTVTVGSATRLLTLTVKAVSPAVATVGHKELVMLRSARLPESKVGASVLNARMDVAQICPVHYGVNLLADDGLTRLAWDDGTQVKY